MAHAGPENSDAAALRFLGDSAGAHARPAEAARPSIVLGFQDGSDTTVDSRSALGRSIRALAEVLALRSRPVRGSADPGTTDNHDTDRPLGGAK